LGPGCGKVLAAVCLAFYYHISNYCNLIFVQIKKQKEDALKAKLAEKAKNADEAAL
jgi:hypothetical protein